MRQRQHRSFGVANYYVYLVSSLPALQFGQKAPLTFDELLARCKEMIPDEDVDLVRTVRSSGYTCAGITNTTLKKWIGFETMLRNELVKIRAARRKADPALYLREDGCPESVYTAHVAINAYRKPALIDAVKTLDLDRWQYLDSLELGHYFDVDILITYACKLRILEKWDAIQSTDTERKLEEVLN